MRRKDRCGPGITNCDGAENVPSSGEEMTTALECVKGVAGRRSPPLANESQVKRENATRADRHRQRGDFTAGFLAEPARPHFTWNLFAEGRGVFHSRNGNVPRSRLVEN